MYSKDEETIFRLRYGQFLHSDYLVEVMSNEKIPMFFWRILMQVLNLNIYCEKCNVSFFLKNSRTIQLCYYFSSWTQVVLFCLVLFVLFWATLEPKAQDMDYYETPFTRWLIPEISKPISLSFGYSSKNKQTFFWATLVLAQQDMDYNKTPFTRWLISQIFKDSCLVMIWGLNNSDHKETQKRKFKTFYFIHESWKLVKLTGHTYARNSLTNFEIEGRAITGNGNAKSWFWKMKSQQTSLNNSDHKETH